MKKNNNLNAILAVFGLVAVIALGYWYNDQSQPGEYDKFAQCLTEKGAKFYGAFWCSHCQKQKALFGKSKQYLPYVECSTADQKGQTEICKEKKIEGYPTWEFMTATGTEIISGEKSIEELKAKTGCQI